ncbi:hypothetical protein LCGC14_0224020 [marine sediment metagenome]|uniref:Uncharacterized protein n=1 Tax=marine sediment metagenome TaxID=412755 RepID=A0A0F9UGP3_9ZZZZ
MPTRMGNISADELDINEIKKLYYGQCRTIDELADELNADYSAVRKRMGIEGMYIRNKDDAKKHRRYAECRWRVPCYKLKIDYRDKVKSISKISKESGLGKHRLKQCLEICKIPLYKEDR